MNRSDTSSTTHPRKVRIDFTRFAMTVKKKARDIGKGDFYPVGFRPMEVPYFPNPGLQ